MSSAFVALFDRLAAVAGAPLEELLGHVLAETAYEEQWKASGDPEDDERLANIRELLTVAREFDERRGGGLEAFLEETSLVNDTDDWQTTVDRVTLMTLHAAKGLEFPVVYIVAVEEGLLPHERSKNQPDQLEEERRLLFVGITRAQRELQISMAAQRDFRGSRRISIPSAFLLELPRAEMDVQVVPAAYSMTREEDIAAEEGAGCHAPRLRGHVDVASSSAVPESHPTSHADASVEHGTRPGADRRLVVAPAAG